MAYQVARVEQSEAGVRYVMTNGESVVEQQNGQRRCLNVHGRGFANTGRFAHIAQAMLKAVSAHKQRPIHLDLCASQDDTMPGHPTCDCGAVEA